MYCALKNSSLRTDKRIRDEETLLIPDEKFSAKTHLSPNEFLPV